jgi:hypothetical protein
MKPGNTEAPDAHCPRKWWKLSQIRQKPRKPARRKLKPPWRTRAARSSLANFAKTITLSQESPTNLRRHFPSNRPSVQPLIFSVWTTRSGSAGAKTNPKVGILGSLGESHHSRSSAPRLAGTRRDRDLQPEN